MENSVYQAPESELVGTDLEAPEFYVVSQKKALLLYFFTAGIYPLYWFYKHWRLYSKKNDKRMWPVLRAIFSIFFTHSLFRLFDDKARTTYTWNSDSVAMVYVIFTIAQSICDRLSVRSVGSPYTDFAGILVMPLIGWSIYKAQAAANIACEDPAGEANNRLTIANYIWMALGSILWLLVGIGLYDIVFGIPALN